jgi:hypothetical protein
VAPRARWRSARRLEHSFGRLSRRSFPRATTGSRRDENATATPGLPGRSSDGILATQRQPNLDVTTTLFAALNMVEGRLTGRCMPRHRHQEFIKFLKRIDAETLPNMDLHLIVDNYAIHKHNNVKKISEASPHIEHTI